ncbi:hypothetical protein ONZ45_g16507 [Pleurotus djamor]|nr:hypothetical protein ONZ45_g16507 [Pleurotus djamor]
MLPCRSHASLMHSRGLLIPICLPWLPGKNIFARNLIGIFVSALETQWSPFKNSKPCSLQGFRHLGDLTNGLEYTYSSPSAYTSTLGFEIDQNPCFHFWSATERFMAAVTLKVGIFGFSMGNVRSWMRPAIPERTKSRPAHSENLEFTGTLNISTADPYFPRLRHPYRILDRVFKTLVFVFKAPAPSLPVAPKLEPRPTARNYRHRINLKFEFSPHPGKIPDFLHKNSKGTVQIAGNMNSLPEALVLTRPKNHELTTMGDPWTEFA